MSSFTRKIGLNCQQTGTAGAAGASGPAAPRLGALVGCWIIPPMAGLLLPVYRGPHGDEGSTGGCRTHWAMPTLLEKLPGAKARARGGRACPFPFLLPQLALCVSIQGSFVHASRGTHNPMLLP